MKHYTMATVKNPSIVKTPMRKLEIPLNKFSDEVIPHHQNMFELHKTSVQKLITLSNVEVLSKEIKDKKRVVKQLKDLMYELDTLRTQVEDNDLDNFDTKTLSLRKIILKLISGYTDLEKSAEKIISKRSEEVAIEKENLDPFKNATKLQLHQNLDDIKLNECHDTLNNIESIHRDVEDLHKMFKDLNEMVNEQSDDVQYTDQSVTSTNTNVQAGLRNLIEAHKLGTLAYPVTGAFLGTLIGGPIGLLAGLKVGGLAAMGCALAGYTGGKMMKKLHVENVETEVVINNENNENHTNDNTSETVCDKKEL